MHTHTYICPINPAGCNRMKGMSNNSNLACAAISTLPAWKGSTAVVHAREQLSQEAPGRHKGWFWQRTLAWSATRSASRQGLSALCACGTQRGRGCMRRGANTAKSWKRQEEVKVTLEALPKPFRVSALASPAFHTPQNLLFIALHLTARWMNQLFRD